MIEDIRRLSGRTALNRETRIREGSGLASPGCKPEASLSRQAEYSAVLHVKI